MCIRFHYFTKHNLNSIIAAVISDILSCRIFLVTTRLAYAVYLTQFPIFFYNVGTTKHSGFYNFFTSTVIVVTVSNSPFFYLYQLILKMIFFSFCFFVNSAICTKFFAFLWYLPFSLYYLIHHFKTLRSACSRGKHSSK